MAQINQWELENINLSKNPIWDKTRRDYYSILNAITYDKSDRLTNNTQLLEAADDFARSYSFLIR